MKEIILIKNGELALKGLNRGSFETALVKDLRRRLSPLGEAEIVRSQSTVEVIPVSDNYPVGEAMERVGRVFGIAGYSRAAVAEKNMESIFSAVTGYFAGELSGAESFKVEAKRADKKFPLRSPEICSAVGEKILAAFPHLRVDVHNPQCVITVEIREKEAYIHSGQFAGAGGMPAGTGGRAEVLISGGIDSPVAAWMTARRGVELNAVHFASPPYTGSRAESKVISLLETVSGYAGVIRLEIVTFTEIQEQIAKNCPEEYSTLIMRRFMMRIAERLAKRRNCSALITGESLGQVASQTLPALVSTDAVTSMPVLRPLIGMDKSEIISAARRIGTFETSILPYEDCCTVFTPKHPKTHPEVKNVEAAESALDIEALCGRAVDSVRTVYVGEG